MTQEQRKKLMGELTKEEIKVQLAMLFDNDHMKDCAVNAMAGMMAAIEIFEGEQVAKDMFEELTNQFK